MVLGRSKQRSVETTLAWPRSAAAANAAAADAGASPRQPLLHRSRDWQIPSGILPLVRHTKYTNVVSLRSYIYIYIRYFDSTYSMCKIAKLILKSSSELKNDCNFIVLLDNLRRPNRIWSIIPVCRSDPSNTPLPSHALWRLPAARVFPESTWQRDSFCLSMPGQADSSGLLWWHLKIHLQLELLQEDCRNFINCWRAQILFRMLCALRTATWPCSAAKCAADKPNKRSVLSAANWLTFQATNLGLNAA